MPEWLTRRAYLTPDRLAIISAELQLSFRELDKRATAMASYIADHGVSEGDRVAVLLRNDVPFVETVHAISRLGATLVPLNRRLTPAELAWQLRDVEAKLLLYDKEHAIVGAKLREACPEVIPALIPNSPHYGEGGNTLHSCVSLPSCEGEELQVRRSIDLDAVHSIIYTSGTTGQPKGAQLTYGNFWWNALGSALNLGLHDTDRWLACLPFYHVGGLSILLRSVIYGITVIVHERFNPVAVNHAIDEDGITIVSVVSTMLQRMLEQRGERPYPPSLRCVLLGGGPAPRPLLEACSQRGIPVVQTYGLTETASQVATLAPADARRKLGSAGKPLFPMQLRIERDGETARPGEIGEIVVSGPTVTPGYYRRPDVTASALRNGWLHTGDLGYLDDEGYLYVLDRRDDLIISGGENIYPAEVEAVLLSHPRIREAGVVGVPDEHWGQVAVAAIVPRLGVELTESEIITFCSERLARYKVPKRVHFVASLPRNSAGKLVRRALRELVEQ
jgi:O-succinylbenzoic acid--CoA ligase